MLVIKLGGSLYNNPALIHWLDAIKQLSHKQTIIIVPGGGPFANQVRLAHQHYDLNESTSHHMALLAMAQFGLLIRDLCHDCHEFYYPTSDLSPLNVWLPDKNLLRETDIEQSWAVTSDSLALWLANQVSAQQLLIVKSCAIAENSTPESLSQQGILDQYFSTLYEKSTITTHIVNADSYGRLSQILSDE